VTRFTIIFLQCSESKMKMILIFEISETLQEFGSSYSK
jgi:hypothetical protein